MTFDRIGKHHSTPARRSGRTAGSIPAKLLTGLALAVSLIVAADLAGAHGDAGELTVTRAEQSGPDRIDLEVGVVHADDDHLATDATVTATFVGPSGDSIGPVPLERVDPDSSLFAAEVEVSGPGSWAVQITSTNPEGATDAEVDVIQAPAETTASTTTSTEPPATTEAPVDGTGSATDEPLDAIADDASTGSDNRWLLIGAAVAAVALVGIVTLALRRNGHGVPDDDTVG